MHSSRMHTGPLVDRMVQSVSGGRGSAPRGVVCLGGVSALGDVCSGEEGVCSGGSAPGGVSQHALRQTPPVDRILDTRL